MKLKRWLKAYSLGFKIKVTFGHKSRYRIKVMLSEISLKLRQMNWNVAKIDVNVVVDETTKSHNNLHLSKN